MATSNDEILQSEAYNQAEKWLRSNYKAYNKTNAMFEKVSVISINTVQ